MKALTSFPSFEQIKKTTDLVTVVQSYGIQLKKIGADDYTGLCPFHEEETPSFHVSSSKNLFHCFGCGAAGNVIQFVARKEGVTEKDAAAKLLTSIPGVRRAEEHHTSSFVPQSRTTADKKSLTEHTEHAEQRNLKPETLNLEHTALFSAVIEHYHDTLFSSDSRGIEYLKSRGLADLEMLKHFKVGFVNGTLREKLSSKQIEAAQDLGLLNEKENDKFYLRVVVPIYSENGEPVGLCGRDITNKFSAKYLYLEGGHKAVWNSEAAKVYPDELILTESIFDALAIWKGGRETSPGQAGKKNVIASYGSSGWTLHHTELVKKHSVRKIVMAYDNDPAGGTGVEKHSELIASLGVEVHRLLWPEKIKDAIEYFQNGGTPESFSSLLSSAVLLRKPDKQARLTLIEKSEESALFKNGSVDYRVRGLSSNGSMRLVLTARQGEVVHTDHFDLYASKSRSAFSGRCAERFGVEEDKIEEDLSVLLEMLEQMKESEKAVPVVAKPAMTEQEKKEALDFLLLPDLMERIASDLEIMGYVGDIRNKKLTYIIGTSRKLPKPLSCIFRSQSGAGKSFLMECVAELMPEEDVHYFSRLTPQALYYMEADALKNKLLIVDERNGSEEAEYPIRTLQTRKVLKLAAPIKDPSTGKIKTVVLEIEGPIAYMESTTSDRINPENSNRCFELYLDESEEQTRAIFAEQRRSRSLLGWQKERLRGRTLQVHHNAQRLLRSLKVIIPYVDLIEFPSSWMRGRRDNDRFLSLVEGVVFLHQYQRKIGLDGERQYVEASVEDYAIAYDLAHQIFAQAGSDLPKPILEFQEEMEQAVCEEASRKKLAADAFWFTRRFVREATRLPDHLVKTYMRQLEELEHLEVERSSRGGSFRYRLVAQKKVRSVLQGLTTPEELERKWKSGTKVEEGQKQN